MAQTNTLIAKSGPMAQQPGQVIFQVAFGSGDTYVTGGVTVDITRFIPPNCNLKNIQYQNFNSNGGHTAYFNVGTSTTNGTLQLFNGTTQLTNGSSLSGVVVTAQIQFGTRIFN